MKEVLNKKRVTLYLPFDVHEEGKKMAAALNMTLSGFVAWLVRSTVEANKALLPEKPFGKMTLQEFGKTMADLPKKAKKLEKTIGKKMVTMLKK